MSLVNGLTGIHTEVELIGYFRGGCLFTGLAAGTLRSSPPGIYLEGNIKVTCIS